MCTVSIVPINDGCRLTCNRDEHVRRPRAEPPEMRRVDRVRSMWPLDPVSGGTWIGVNEAGLVACLLNRNSGRSHPATREVLSRGTIIPLLLRAHHLTGALVLTRALPAWLFAPFTLLLVHGRTLAHVTNASDGMRVTLSRLDRPEVFTSSGLGDHVVAVPRRVLFTRMVVASPLPLEAQVVFHDHCWPQRPEISVRMRRADAATVSRTQIDVADGLIRLQYRSLYH
jgi:hypothetical protein